MLYEGIFMDDFNDNGNWRNIEDHDDSFFVNVFQEFDFPTNPES